MTLGQNVSRFRSELMDDKDPIWELFRKCLCQRWWRRVWIIQEACLSHELAFIIGDTRIAFETFRQAYDACVALELPLFGYSTHEGVAHETILHAGLILHAVKQRGAAMRFFAASEMIDILITCRNLQASDPRDHCYALLGLSKEIDVPELFPDYERSTGSVFTKYATLMIQQGHGDRISWSNFVPVLDGSQPSWVPDWSDNNYRNALLSYQHLRGEKLEGNERGSRIAHTLSTCSVLF